MDKKRIIAMVCLMILAAHGARAQNPSQGPETDNRATIPARVRTIHLAGGLPVDSFPWRAAQLFYTEAFRRMGYGFALEGLPLERALVEANAGRLDGDVGRVQFDDNLSMRYPNLIQVPAIIATFEVMTYTTDPSIRLHTWSDLDEKGLIIGHHRGHQLSRNKLLAHVPQQDIIEISNIRQGLLMLTRGRIDILITSKLLVESVLSNPRFKESGIMPAGMLEKFKIYPYLHKKNSALVPQLASVLNAMKDDGTYERLVAQARQHAQ